MIDCHIHLLGDGTSGSGCVLRLSALTHKILARIILNMMQIPASSLNRNLDLAYSEKILQMIEESELSHAVLLAHEHPYSSTGKRIENFGSFYVPNSYVIEISKRSKKILTGLSIHPARCDAIDELDSCAAQGMSILKLLPNCQNVDCSLEKYIPFWERLAKYKIPFLAHTGGELSVPVYDKRFADPRYLKLPLECGVTVIAAHGSTSSHFLDKNYTNELGEMLEKFPNLFLDNSALNTPLRSRHFKTLLKEPFASRVIYGSDFPIPISSRWIRIRGLISREDARRIDGIKNLLDKDIATKRALGFPVESFTKLYSLLPQKSPS